MKKYLLTALFILVTVLGFGAQKVSAAAFSLIQQPLSGNHDWRGIASDQSGQHLVAAAWNDYIYTSSDFGVHWTQQTAMGVGGWYSATESLNGQYMAVTKRDSLTSSNNGVVTSSDYGSTWTLRDTSACLAFTGYSAYSFSGAASSSDGSKIFIVMDPVVSSSTLQYDCQSTNGGVTWTKNLVANTNDYFEEIASSTDGMTLYIVDYNNGHIYKSIDGGLTWNLNYTVSGAHLEGVSTDYTGHNVVVSQNDLPSGGAGGSLYMSADSGATWVQKTSAGIKHWEDFKISGDGNIVVANDNTGYIWNSNSSSGFNTWAALAADNVPVTNDTASGGFSSATLNGTILGAGVSHNWMGLACSKDCTKFAATVSGSGYVWTRTSSTLTPYPVNAAFIYGTTSSYGSTTTPTLLTGPSSYSFVLSGPFTCQTYHYRAVILDSTGTTILSAADIEKTFIPSPSCLSVVHMTSVVATGSTPFSAILTGHLSSLGSAPGATTVSFTDYNTALLTTTTVVPTASSFTTLPTGGVDFTATLTSGLYCGVPVLIDAVANNSAGSYVASPPILYTPPCSLNYVVATAAAAVTQSSATINGQFTYLSNIATGPTVFGFTGTFPSTSLGIVTPASYTAGAGSVSTLPFSATLTGLTCGTTYTYHSTASNSAGTATSPTAITLTTLPCALPVVSNVIIPTTFVTPLSSTSALITGHLTSTGGSSTTVSFNLTGTGATLGAVTPATFSAGAAGADFTATVTGLTCGTGSYTFTAKATNTMGVATATPAVPFSVPCTGIPPIVVTNAPTITATTSATLNGNLTSFGSYASSPVTGYFVFDAGTTYTTGGFSSTITPGSTTVPNTPIALSAVGPFSTDVTGLACGVVYKYHAFVMVPAYSIFISGTPTVTFTIPCTPPSVATTSITAAGSSLSGIISKNLTGTLVSTGGNATTVGFNVSGGTLGTITPATFVATSTGGSFTTVLSGLACGNTYTVKATANNGGATVYGSPLSVSTPSCLIISGGGSSTTTTATGTSATGGSVVTAGALMPVSPAAIGDNNTNVLAIQNVLIFAGYLEDSSATGVYGKNTRNAVMAFQADKGFTLSGNVGPKTTQALNDIVTANTPVPPPTPVTPVVVPDTTIPAPASAPVATPDTTTQQNTSSGSAASPDTTTQQNAATQNATQQAAPAPAAQQQLPVRRGKKIIIDPNAAQQQGGASVIGAITQGPVTFTEYMTYGSTGDQVTALQQILKNKGYMTSDPSGFFGKETIAGLKKLQSDNGLMPIGRVGNLTLNLLNSF